MAEGVVDVLEVVEIDEQHRDLPRAAAPAQRVLELGLEQQAIGQAGQRIVMRHVLDLRFGLLLLGDILVSGDPAAVRQRLGHDVDRPPVAADDQHLGGLGGLEQFLDPLEIGVGVRRQRSRGLAILDELAQRAARPDNVIRQAVHPQVRPVADHDPAVGVEHQNALDHIVQRLPQEAVFSVQQSRAFVTSGDNGLPHTR